MIWVTPYFLFSLLFFILDGKEFGSLGANPSGQCGLFPSLDSRGGRGVARGFGTFFWRVMRWSKRRPIALKLTGGR